MIDWKSAHEYNALQLADGSLPPDQLAAVVARFQAEAGLTVDGKFGPRTRLEFARQGEARTEAVLYMVELALEQAGKPYRFGAEVSLDDPDPPVFDCSELVQWAAARAGLDVPDGSWRQVTACRDAGTLVDVATAERVRGALLFHFKGDPFAGERPASAHVAVSLGDGRTIEARSRRYGVGSWPVAGRPWTHAGLVPR